MLMETFVTRDGATTLDSESVTTLDSQEVQEIVGEEAERSPAAAIAALVRARMAVQGSGQSLPRLSAGHGATAVVDEDDAWVRSDVRAALAGVDFGGITGFALSRGGRGPRSPDSSIYPGMDVEPGARDRSVVKGYLITGSEDHKIRFWDLGKPERSAVVSGLDIEAEEPDFKYVSVRPIPESLPDLTFYFPLSGPSVVYPTRHALSSRPIQMTLRNLELLDLTAAPDSFQTTNNNC